MKKFTIQGILLGAAIAVILSAAIPGDPHPAAHEVSFWVEVYDDGSMEAMLTADPSTPIEDVAVWWNDSPDGTTASQVSPGVWSVAYVGTDPSQCHTAIAEVVIGTKDTSTKSKAKKSKKSKKSHRHKGKYGKKKGKKKKGKKAKSAGSPGHSVLLTLSATSCLPPEDCPEAPECPEHPGQCPETICPLTDVPPPGTIL